MALTVPPPPIKEQIGTYTWQEWFRQIRDRANASITTVLWSSIDFAGSKLSDIVNKAHNVLDSIQGGTTGEYYHLTSSEYSELGRSDNVVSVAVNTSLSDSHRELIASVTGLTITLPAASTARIGHIWSVTLGATGRCTVVRAGSDTILTPTSATDTSVIMTIRGTTLDFMCASSSTWVIV